VSLVAILDADKEGFLRSARSLIQTCGRAARNLAGRVIMYADRVTGSMQNCLDETNRRRAIQGEYNRANDITPRSIKKGLRTILESIEDRDYYTIPVAAEAQEDYVPVEKIPRLVKQLRKEMLTAAKELNFEKAVELRDRIRKLEDMELALR
jgi:excinuclease ABC subunit B